MKRVLMFFFVVLGVGMFSFTKANDLAQVSLSFCSQEEHLNIVLEPGVETGICYQLTNRSKHDVVVKIGFVDGTFTNDEWKNRACQLDDQIQMFGKYVTGYSSLITLKPNQTYSGIALLKYPQNMQGLFHGCMIYSVGQADSLNSNGGTSFSIQMRKAKFIDVVSGDPDSLLHNNFVILEDFTSEDGPNLSSNSKIRIYKDFDNKYIVALKLKNISVFDQNVFITGMVSNYLIYNESFQVPRVLTPGQSLIITQKLSDSPYYIFSLKLLLSYFPNVFNNMQAKGGNIEEFTWFVIWDGITYLTLIGILIVSFIIWLLIKNLGKSVSLSQNKKNLFQNKKKGLKK